MRSGTIASTEALSVANFICAASRRGSRIPMGDIDRLRQAAHGGAAVHFRYPRYRISQRRMILAYFGATAA